MEKAMDQIKEVIDAAVSWLLMPATLIGGAGGLLSSISHRHGAARCGFNAVCGAVVANIVFPVIARYCPEPWHYTLFFLSGIGGLKMVETVYGWLFEDGLIRDVLKAFLERLSGKKGE